MLGTESGAELIPGNVLHYPTAVFL